MKRTISTSTAASMEPPNDDRDDDLLDVFKSFSFVLGIFCLLINHIHGYQLHTTSAGGIGAVYTMTNGLTKNQVIVNRLSASGDLTWVKMVDTDGIGGNSAVNNPFFSQGAMVVYSSYLFVVNAGSNSLSMLKINPLDATDLTLISVKSTYGFFPVSVTVNSAYACVLTGGNVTGIRCFTYDSSGLSVVSSFDRDLTSYISQSVPPKGPPGTFSEILFSSDDRALIILVKGYNATSRGYLSLYQFSVYATQLSLYPIQQTPADAILPFSMTSIEMDGLLITDPGANGVLTLTYLSTNSLINKQVLTPIDASIAGALCLSTYSPIIDNYYVIGAAPAAIVELHVNLSSSASPVQIIRYYPLPKNIGVLVAIVVSLHATDYLYVLGSKAQVISSYRLVATGDAVSNGIDAAQQGNMTDTSKIVGIAAFVQTIDPWSSS